jgi:hypothetical protein
MAPPPHRHLVTGNQLGSIVPTPIYYDKLNKLVLSAEEMKTEGYKVTDIASGDLLRMRRCKFCRSLFSLSFETTSVS